ncbi:MAG: hypothetical protein PWQ50_175 [Methanolobus sp.]|jgi:hypothetical protein|nr:hypothetical protein [Methanolobus sp.]
MQELAEDFINFEEFDLIESKNYYESRDQLITKMLHDSLDMIVSALNLTYSQKRNVGVGVSNNCVNTIPENSFLNLLNAYHLITFCSYEKSINSDYISDEDALDLSKFNLHLSGLFYILTGIVNKVSFEQNEFKENYPNYIKGRLDSKKYIQQYSNYSNTNFVPCIVKKRNYDLLENQLVCVSILLALKKISEIQYSYLKKYPKSVVTQKINFIYNKLSLLLSHEFFHESVCLSSQIIRSNDKGVLLQFIDKVKRKFNKNKIRNKYYFALIAWIKIFSNFNGSICSINIDYLLPLSSNKNQTVDMLFEFWVLKQIISGLENNPHVVIEKMNPLAARDNESVNLNKFICKFTFNSNRYFLYFQHTNEICYDAANPPVWKKKNLSNDTTKILGGRPDYSILIQGMDEVNKKTIVVDAKNKPGNKTGTEEVYKIIGYFDNFSRKLGEDATGILVFRKNKGQGNWIDDFDSLYEKENNDKKAKIWKIGIDPLGNSTELDSQKNKIVNAILDGI